MSLLALPSETLDAVCTLALHRDRLALATTNRRLSVLARRLLYRSIHVSETSTNKTCVLTLSQNAHLARAVRHFAIVLSSTHSAVFAAYLRVLRTALSNMTHLLTLTVFTGAEHPLVPDAAVAFPHLRSFACDFPLDETVAAFLSGCPSLEELQLDIACDATRGGRLLPPMDPVALTKLRSFLGTTDAARALVPGRPVAAIHLHLTDVDGEDTLAALSHSATAVTSVHAVIGMFSLRLLQDIAYHLPEVEDLRVSVLHAFDTLPDPAFLALIADVLDSFENLCCFQLSGVHWKYEPDGTRKSWQPSPRAFCSDDKPPESGYDWEVLGDFLEQEDWATAAW